jgi:drug/metabolite transporter (DMT)-like permease
MTNTFPKSQVYFVLALGLVAFGFAPILVRLTPDTPPLVLATYRTVLAVVFLLPYWIIKRDRPETTASGNEFWWIALSGICLGVHFICWIASLYYTSVASASVLVTIHPVILILAERLLYKRSFASTTWIGVFVAFGGSVLLGISDSRMEHEFSDPLFGNLLAVTAALIFVVYLLIGQKVRQNREWVDYVFPVYAFAAATCVILTLLAGNNLLDISITGLAVGAGLALGPQLLGHGSMNYAVKFVSPTLLATLILAEPLFASALAFFLFEELPPLPSIAAMVLILGGVALTWRRKSAMPVTTNQ